MSTPHLTELLDLTAIVNHVTRLAVAEGLKASGLGTTDYDVDEAIAATPPAELQRLRTGVLAIAYPTARAIAEQAYAKAWDRARELVDARTSEADDTLGTLDGVDTAIEPDHVRELNPFAEGAVTV